MRVACAVACLLAAPEATSFHVSVRNALPRSGIAPFASRASAAAAAVQRATAARRAAGPSIAEAAALRMSQEQQAGGARGESARGRRLSTLLSASAVVAGGSGLVETVEGLRGGGGDQAVAVKENKLFKAYETGARWFTNLFPIWLCVFSGVALKDPSVFAWFTTEYFTAALAVLMLSMGITLSPKDFVNVLKRPNAVMVGFVFCYIMMPGLAYALGIGAGLSPALLAGLVLVGCINGGQASNLCTFIANGNVALSVMMTTITTLGAIVMTPLLCKLLLGTVVPVDAVGIAFSTVQVVLAPIVVGMMTNKFFPGVVKAVLPVTPVVGVLSTCFLVASAVAPTIISAGLALQIPIILLHLLGGLIGYFLPKAMGFSEVSSRTMAIETSMKSSAFGFLLAKLHFGSFEARVPAAISVVWMAITGSMMAIIWRYIPVETPKFDRGVKDRFEKINFLSVMRRKFGKDAEGTAKGA
ncbi:unnamed protein product [Ectocarpus sp. 4 AP-2014]